MVFFTTSAVPGLSYRSTVNNLSVLCIFANIEPHQIYTTRQVQCQGCHIEVQLTTSVYFVYLRIENHIRYILQVQCQGCHIEVQLTTSVYFVYLQIENHIRYRLNVKSKESILNSTTLGKLRPTDPLQNNW